MVAITDEERDVYLLVLWLAAWHARARVTMFMSLTNMRPRSSSRECCYSTRVCENTGLLWINCVTPQPHESTCNLRLFLHCVTRASRLSLYVHIPTHLEVPQITLITFMTILYFPEPFCSLAHSVNALFLWAKWIFILLLSCILRHWKVYKRLKAYKPS